MLALELLGESNSDVASLEVAVVGLGDHPWVVGLLVSVSASCNNIELWAACCVGAIGSVIYSQTKKLISRLEIDDPLDVSEVHGFCGIWAVLAVGIFDKDYGFFYTGKAD